MNHDIFIGMRNILLGANLSSLSLWRKPGRWAIYATEVLATLDSIRNKKGVPLRNVQDVLKSGPVTVTLADAWMDSFAGYTATWCRSACCVKSSSRDLCLKSGP